MIVSAASASQTNTGIALANARLRNDALAAENARLKATVRELQDFMRGCEVTGRTALTDMSHKLGIPIEHLISETKSRAIWDAKHEAMYEVARRCPWLTVEQFAALFRCHKSSIATALVAWPAKAKAKGIELPTVTLTRKTHANKGRPVGAKGVDAA